MLHSTRMMGASVVRRVSSFVFSLAALSSGTRGGGRRSSSAGPVRFETLRLLLLSRMHFLEDFSCQAGRLRLAIFPAIHGGKGHADRVGEVLLGHPERVPELPDSFSGHGSTPNRSTS